MKNLENSSLEVNVDNNSVNVCNNHDSIMVNGNISTHRIGKDSIVKENISNKRKSKKENGDQKKGFDPCMYEFSFFKSEGFLNAWINYCEHRAEKKKPLTERACRIVETELNLVSEAVAIALLKKAVLQGWTGVNHDWIKEEEQNKINRAELSSVLGPSIPVKIIEEIDQERRLRADRWDLITISSPDRTSDPDNFRYPLAISVYHKPFGKPGDLRDDVNTISARILKVPTQADGVNWNYILTYMRIPHHSGYLLELINEWKREQKLSWADLILQMRIMCSFDEYFACAMVKEAIKSKARQLSEVSVDREKELLNVYSIETEDDKQVFIDEYMGIIPAWAERKRREWIFGENMKQGAVPSDLSWITWPKEHSVYHEPTGAPTALRSGIEEYLKNASANSAPGTQKPRRYLNDMEEVRHSAPIQNNSVNKNFFV